MRNKKILILIIVLVSILVLTGVTFAILYFTTDIFISNDKLFLKYASQNSKILDVMKNENIEEQKTLLESNSYTTNGNLTVSMTSQEMLGEKTINILTSSRRDINTGRTYSDFTLKNGEADVIKASYINSGDFYAIKIDEILGYYIGFRNSGLKQFAKNMGLDDETINQIPDSVNFEEMSSKFEISEEDKNHIIETYSDVIMEGIKKENYSKVKNTISVSEQKYECNGYVLNLSGEEIKQILINCLNKIKEDEFILGIYNRLTSDIEEQIDITENIDQLVAEMQQENMEGNFSITVYERNRKLLRTEIEIENSIKVIVDLIENDEEQKVNIIIQESESETLTDDLRYEPIVENDNAIQINLTKKKENNGVTNNIEIIPDKNDSNTKIILSKTIEKAQDNTIQNTATTIIESSEGEKVQSTYNKSIQIGTQIEEILELKDSNAIILNNYSLEQLTPFITQLTGIMEQKLPGKLQELNLTDDTILVPGILSAGISIVNANGIGIESPTSIVVGGVVGAGAIVYYSSANIIDSTQSAQTQLRLQEIEEYNSKFISYQGEQRGSETRTLCQLVKTHNLTNQDNQVDIVTNSAYQITTEPIEEVTSEKIEQIRSQISADKTYVVDFGYSGSTGKIVAIGIVEK